MAEQEPTPRLGNVRRVWAVLTEAADSGGPTPSIREMARMLHLHHCTVVRCIRRLEDLQYVSRQGDCAVQVHIPFYEARPAPKQGNRRRMKQVPMWELPSALLGGARNDVYMCDMLLGEVE